MAKSNSKKLGDRIFDLRKLKGISQDDLAKSVGVTRQTVMKWEANRVKPKTDKLLLICDALGVGADALISRESKDKSSNDNVDVTTKEVVCDDATVNDHVEINSESTKNKHKSKKVKITIVATVLSIVLLIGIVFIVLGTIMEAPMIDGEGGREVDTIWNYSLENIGWAIFGIFMAFAVIIGTILICRVVRNKRNNEEPNNIK